MKTPLFRRSATGLALSVLLFKGYLIAQDVDFFDVKGTGENAGSGSEQPGIDYSGYIPEPRSKNQAVLTLYNESSRKSSALIEKAKMARRALRDSAKAELSKLNDAALKAGDLKAAVLVRKANQLIEENKSPASSELSDERIVRILLNYFLKSKEIDAKTGYYQGGVMVEYLEKLNKLLLSQDRQNSKELIEIKSERDRVSQRKEVSIYRESKRKGYIENWISKSATYRVSSVSDTKWSPLPFVVTLEGETHRNGDFSFHTGSNGDEWIAFDLQTSYTLSKVEIENRKEGNHHRIVGAVVELSENGKDWVEALRIDKALAKYELPLRNRTARFVRIRQPNKEYLHFIWIKIFARFEL